MKNQAVQGMVVNMELKEIITLQEEMDWFLHFSYCLNFLGFCHLPHMLSLQLIMLQQKQHLSFPTLRMGVPIIPIPVKMLLSMQVFLLIIPFIAIFDMMKLYYYIISGEQGMIYVLKRAHPVRRSLWQLSSPWAYIYFFSI